MTDSALLNASVSELRKLLRNKTVSSEELTRAYLSSIERHNPALNAVVTVCPDQALDGARQADAALAKGEHGLLTGVPLLHKDIFARRMFEQPAARACWRSLYLLTTPRLSRE